MPEFNFKEFFLKERNLERVTRFSARMRIRDQSVAEHSFHVCMYVMILADMEIEFGNKVDVEKLLRTAILHDLEETATGDVMHDFKYKSETLKAEMKKLSLEFFEELLQNLPESASKKYSLLWKNQKDMETIEGKILFAADRFEALMYLLEESSVGNKTFENTIQEIVEVLKEVDLKSVKVLLQEMGFLDDTRHLTSFMPVK